MARKRKTKQPTWTPRQRSALSIALGLGFGLWCAFTTFGVVNRYQLSVALAEEEKLVEVLVTTRPLRSGMKIQADDLVALPIALEMWTEGMATHPGQVVGRYARERILPNEVVRRERLADPENGIGLNAVLPRGMRAISIEIADAQALGGHLEPGSFVDIAATFLPDGDEDQIATHTVAQGLFVLAVNEKPVQLTPQEEREVQRASRPTVTFLVRPEDAKRLAFAELATHLNLTLRSPLDVAFAQTPGADLDDLFAIYDAQRSDRDQSPREAVVKSLR